MSKQARGGGRCQTPVVHVHRLEPAVAAPVLEKLVAELLADGPARDPARIVVKINLCEYRRPESGAVTDPQFLLPLVQALQARFPGRPVFLAEADATSLDADSAFRYMSIDRVARATGAALLNFSKGEWAAHALPDGLVFREVWLPRLLDAQTLYVNFSKLKINSGTRITGCLKNNYALIRAKNKAQYHPVVEEAVRDINAALHRTGVGLLNIIEGYIGMETMGGPAFGRPKRCELILGSIDPVAVDACEARVIGMRPGSIRHIVLCARAGVGSPRYTLSTDIPGFRYRDYKFRFEAFQYWLRQRIKKHAGIGL
jgi:uncharacterized protein (DUF362 family)